MIKSIYSHAPIGLKRMATQERSDCKKKKITDKIILQLCKKINECIRIGDLSSKMKQMIPLSPSV